MDDNTENVEPMTTETNTTEEKANPVTTAVTDAQTAAAVTEATIAAIPTYDDSELKANIAVLQEKLDAVTEQLQTLAETAASKEKEAIAEIPETETESIPEVPKKKRYKLGKKR